MARRLFAGASGYSFKEWCGTFYPDKMKPEAMLGVVRGAAASGRNQQHLLPHAGHRNAGALGAGHAAGLPLRDQGVAPHHAHRAHQGDGPGLGRLPVHATQGPRRQTRAGAVSAAAEPEEGPAAPRCVLAHAARAPSRRVRVPQRQLVRRRRLHGAARCRRAALAVSSARTAACRRSKRLPTGATCGCGSRTIRTTGCATGRSGSRPPAGGDLRVLHARADRAGVRAGADATLRCAAAARGRAAPAAAVTMA